jgi:hypothetical protein
MKKRAIALVAVLAVAGGITLVAPSADASSWGCGRPCKVVPKHPGK